MTKEELVAQVRHRLASGRLRRDRPTMLQTPPATGVAMTVESARGAPCDACDGREGTVIAYPYPDGVRIRLHPECEEIWEIERRRLSPRA
jgi:hypothetical protein